LEKPVNRFHVPCRHAELCQDCCTRVKNTCPVCRSRVEQFLPFFP
jgi:hypothetical protein